jgi:ribosomal protein L20
MRVRTGVAKNRRLKRILKQVKGYRGARRRRIKLAKEAIVRAGVQAYVGRRLKKTKVDVPYSFRGTVKDLTRSSFFWWKTS